MVVPEPTKKEKLESGRDEHRHAFGHGCWSSGCEQIAWCFIRQIFVGIYGERPEVDAVQEWK